MSDVFSATFKTEAGNTMLYWILNNCGYFSTDPALVSPQLIAFANRLLSLGNINVPENAGNYINKIMSATNLTIKEEDDYEI